MKRIHCIVQFFGFAILLSAAASYLEATPFDMIVPLTMTLNTYNAGGIQGPFGGWLIATSSPLVFNQPFGFAYGTSVNNAVSDTSGITAYDGLLVTSNPAGLTPGEALAYPPDPIVLGADLYSTELQPSEQTAVYPNGGMEYITSINNPPEFTGTANLDFTFAIYQDVAQYSVLVTFVDNPNETEGLVDITSVQRVSSVFDPNYPPPTFPESITPEPRALLTVFSGVVFFLLMAWGTRRCSPNRGA